MSTAARRRLMRDFRRLKNDPPSGISGAPLQSNILSWQAVIFGPDDTPWEGGTFNLTLEFTEEYPNKPPKVKFITKMFHPNIYNDGQICLDILQVSNHFRLVRRNGVIKCICIVRINGVRFMIYRQYLRVFKVFFVIQTLNHQQTLRLQPCFNRINGSTIVG